MQKNSILRNNSILLFKKKISNIYYNNNNNLILSNIEKMINTVKHFPPANKEWINSIYSYNSKKIKHLIVKDKILFNIIKSYFNLYNIKEQNKININNVHIRFKRLSNLKIFVSKAEIKHTNAKATITIYVYNRQKVYLINKINNILILNKLIEMIKLIEEQNIKISEQIKKEKNLINCPIILQDTIKIYEDQRYRDFILKSLEKKIFTIYIKQLLHFNKSKFEDTYLFKLNNIIRKIYEKNIDFNIIHLKYIHLNSDILTQSIILKLKRKKNYVLKVLKKLFKFIKISPLNKVILIRYIENDLMNKIYNSINIYNKNYNDNLNQTLFSLFSLKNKKMNLESLILNSIKHKYINGIRLEAKGRLSKRRTASKSVFKLKYKGSLKNIDSSYKGISTIILRGHIKSNIQYTKLNSKTHNGSFGIKGWISSK